MNIDKNLRSDSKNRKIVVLLYSMVGGGTEKVSTMLCNAFIRKNIQVTIVLVKNEGFYLTKLDNSIKVLSLNNYLSRLGYIGKVIALWFTLRKETFSTILAMGEWPNSLAPICNRLFLKGMKTCIISERSAETFINKNNIYGTNLFTVYLSRISYSLADKIICVSGLSSQNVRFNVKKIKEEKISVIPNPVDIESINIMRKEIIHHSWFLDESILVLVAVGRLHKQKDYPTMLKAFKIAMEEKNIRLIILGDGSEYQNLANMAANLGVKDYVEFAGFVNNPYNYIGNADLLIHSARYEGMSNVLLEALACGVKIVTTKCDNGLLLNGRFGDVVPVADSKALAKAIIKKLDEKVEKNNLIERAKEFSIEKISNMYINSIISDEDIFK